MMRYGSSFKYEGLPDFCFRCGFLDYVIERCTFNKPATITSAQGVTVKVFGPWLKAEIAGNLHFVNLPEEGEVPIRITQNRKSFTMILYDQNNREHS